jgi:hypothetical protein
MALNLIKKYNQLLELGSFNEYQRIESLRLIFKRDFEEFNQIVFNQKKVTPTPVDGVIKMETLFTHLITVMVDKVTRKREYDNHRSIRLHWVKYHLDNGKNENMYLFSVKEPEGYRTYFYDNDEKYVVVLEPLRNKNEYYLLTAYYLTGKDVKRDKIMAKYTKRRLNEIL